MKNRLKTSSPKIPLLIILGPTAVGKSDVAVALAKKFNGEVISADSRQVYKGLNIGTGKITKKEMKGVKHQLLDVASPKSRFTAEKYRTLARRAIADISKRGKLPILCGGTGFYIDGVLGNSLFADVPPNEALRKKLVSKSPEALMAMLKELDSVRAKVMQSNYSESRNSRRLIRAIEVAKGKNDAEVTPRGVTSYAPIFIGLNVEPRILRERIRARLLKRIKAGMIREAKKLHVNGLSWRRMEELGLEYRYLALYLQKKMTKEQMIEKLDTEIWRYAKRQMTWFKRDRRIQWFTPDHKTEIIQSIQLALRRE